MDSLYLLLPFVFLDIPLLVFHIRSSIAFLLRIHS
nr:MAG TPA: hypothetical protein [Caudoviricetes sp.]